MSGVVVPADGIPGGGQGRVGDFHEVAQRRLEGFAGDRALTTGLSSIAETAARCSAPLTPEHNC